MGFRAPLLLPTPRRLERAAGELRLADGLPIALAVASPQDALPLARRLRDALRRHTGLRLAIDANPPIGAGIALALGDTGAGPESYALTIGPEGVRLEAGDLAGLFHGVSTLIQIAIQCGRCWPALRIRDAPDFPHRGVMLDISRDKVPTMATLRQLVDLLASWKINQLQLYTEHTFAYRDHRTVWERASPMTAEEILDLDAWCRERHIELVPNQSSFGHMERWLKHPAYRDLAEAPDGCETCWGWRPASGLNPLDPRSLDLIRGLYDELLPHFSSRQLNVGCDETVDLGLGRSRADAERLGIGRLYLDFLRKIHRDLAGRGRTMQFWGDIVLAHPELVRELPKDLVALLWGYEHDHPFEAQARAFAESGVPFYVCPGTSTWTALLGRTANMLGNVASACEQGLANGAIGVLTTDWGDGGHWQSLPFSYAGFAYGAATSWCLESNRGIDLAGALDRFAFEDSADRMGTLVLELGHAGSRLDERLGQRTYNGTPFARALEMTLDQLRELYGDRAGAQRAVEETAEAVHHWAQGLARAAMHRPDGRLVAAEVALGARMAGHGCRRLSMALESSPGRQARMRRELRRDLRGILRAFGPLWHARNRPGGYGDSAARLRKLLDDDRSARPLGP